MVALEQLAVDIILTSCFLITMEPNDELVDLFSNATNERGYHNSSADFVNTLPEYLDLSETEVGVKQVSVPPTWQRDNHASFLHWIVIKGSPMQGLPFEREANIELDDYVRWIGSGNKCLFFTLRPGLYYTAKDVADQVVSQTNKAFSNYRKGNPLARPLVVEYKYLVQSPTQPRALFQEKTGTISLFGNKQLCALLHYGERDPNHTYMKQYIPILADYPGIQDGDVIENTEQSFKDWYEKFHIDPKSNAFKRAFDNDTHFRPLMQLRGEAPILSTDAMQLEHKVNMPYSAFNNNHKNVKVYTDIIENRIVDDAMEPLLCQVPTLSYTHRKDVTCDLNVWEPTYVPTKSIRTRHIHVWITDENGHKITFPSGNVHILLHFRKRNAI